mgnify:CR=1 FL=1
MKTSKSQALLLVQIMSMFQVRQQSRLRPTLSEKMAIYQKTRSSQSLSTQPRLTSPKTSHLSPVVTQALLVSSVAMILTRYSPQSPKNSPSKPKKISFSHQLQDLEFSYSKTVSKLLTSLTLQTLDKKLVCSRVQSRLQ